MDGYAMLQIADLERKMAMDGSQAARNVADVDSELEKIERDRDRVRAERDELSKKQVCCKLASGKAALFGCDIVSEWDLREISKQCAQLTVARMVALLFVDHGYS
jgi:hypothetical protein